MQRTCHSAIWWSWNHELASCRVRALINLILICIELELESVAPNLCKSIRGNVMMIARKLGTCSPNFWPHEVADDYNNLLILILLITLFSLRMGIIRNLNNNNSFLHLGQHHVKFHSLITLFQVAIEGNYVNLPNVGLDNISVRSRLLLLPGDQNSSIFFLSLPFFVPLFGGGGSGEQIS